MPHAATDSIARANDQIFFVIEKTGPNRQMWGPYDLATARRECGIRHTIIRGGGLTDGQTLAEGAVQSAVGSGRIWTIDGDDLV